MLEALAVVTTILAIPPAIVAIRQLLRSTRSCDKQGVKNQDNECEDTE